MEDLVLHLLHSDLHPPSDEVPMSPAWADARTGDGIVAEDGEVLAEWARCQALDLASTRVYASTTEITNVLGMDVHSEILPQTEIAALPDVRGRQGALACLYLC